MSAGAATGSDASAPLRRCRIGLVGFGSVGQYLADRILHEPAAGSELELAWVWNRNADRLSSLPAALCMKELESFASGTADLIVEVCHPGVASSFGPRFLSAADLFIGSPTVFADADADAALRSWCVCHDNLRRRQPSSISLPFAPLPLKLNSRHASAAALPERLRTQSMSPLARCGGARICAGLPSRGSWPPWRSQ